LRNSWEINFFSYIRNYFQNFFPSVGEGQKPIRQHCRHYSDILSKTVLDDQHSVDVLLFSVRIRRVQHIFIDKSYRKQSLMINTASIALYFCQHYAVKNIINFFDYILFISFNTFHQQFQLIFRKIN